VSAGIVNIRREARLEQGFEVYRLQSPRLEIAVVPELGARIISLKNLQTGREWMWHRKGKLRLFRNRLGDDFSQSPLVGADECLPTIAPCCVRNRQLPDHGEVWSAAWGVNAEAWEEGVLQTSVDLPISPFEFERTLTVQDSQVNLSYRLRNRGEVEESYLWALHPLLRLEPGDRLQLPATTRALLNGEAWIDAVDAVIPQGGCSKLFARPLAEGAVEVRNRDGGDRLRMEWDPAENDTLGLWLTRGGWHEHHHLAVEPTNGAPDALAVAARQGCCGIVPACSSRTWRVTLRVGP